MSKLFAFAIFVAMSAPASAACSASASRDWGKGLVIEAFAQGPRCDQTVATLTIRKKSGAAIWAKAAVANFLMNFTQPPPADAGALKLIVKDWISGSGFMKSADKLATEGEFPFTLNETVDAAAFANYRKNKAPIFCYVQGMESGNCLVLDSDGTIVELGIQSFPG